MLRRTRNFDRNDLLTWPLSCIASPNAGYDVEAAHQTARPKEVFDLLGCFIAASELEFFTRAAIEIILKHINLGRAASVGGTRRR